MKRIFWIGFLFTAILLPHRLLGQWLSPGKLSASHAFLEGMNNCTLCHNIGEKITEEKCLACHSKISLQLEEQQGYHFVNRDQNCTECHHEHRGVKYSLIDLDKQTFDHAKIGFKIEGAHKKQDCNACHKTTGTYSGLEKSCLACHDDAFHGRLDENCEKCHHFDAFKPSTFKHKENDLATLHEEVACNSCHLNGHFRGLNQDCRACHKDEHKGQLAQNCEQCHKVTRFSDLKFDHNQQAAFKLEKQHLAVLCEDCHANQLYERPSTACNECHADEHKGQPETDCATCHVVDGFAQITFKHEKPNHVLEGKHRELACESCHRAENYSDTPKTCVDCHKDAHKGELDQKCETCHTYENFDSTTFKHESPNYELTGAHKTLACNSCHLGADYRPLSTQCASCHLEHKGDASSHCEECHTTHVFKPSTFKHHENDFQAKGKHQKVECSECHATGLFKSLDSECTTCHADVHESRLGDNCTQCHQFDTWKTVAYDHNVSDYLLKGRHLDLKCEECHVQGVFAGTRTECFSCHRDPHQGRFGQDCESCHTEDGWTLLQYNHDMSGYPLQGVHEQLECSACHPYDRVVGTPQHCFGCHRLDYEAAIEPNHQAAKFSVECEECHKVTDISWEFGYWLEHESIFPLRSSSAGHHSNFSCSECHPTVTSYKKYNCLACHDRGDMEPAHADVRKYKYQNNKCLDCHPAGEIEELEDDH